MKIKFHIEYFTEFGQNLFISGSIPELGSWNDAQSLRMHYVDNGKWEATIDIDPKSAKGIYYKYFLIDDRNAFRVAEFGEPRSLKVSDITFDSIQIFDHWHQYKNITNALNSSAFSGNLWRRKKGKKKSVGYYNHQFKLYEPRIDQDHAFCLVGSEDSLGNWDPDKAVVMDDAEYPIWKAEVFLENNEPLISYKYGIYNKKTKKMVSWEAGYNRSIDHSLSPIDNAVVLNTDNSYNHPSGNWRGAGMAIPVFSLRTANSYGVGEFPDIKLLVDWAVQTGMKLVQILPINDTVANHDWKDSYPYAAISVFALHPIYLNLPAMGKLKDKKTMAFIVKQGQELNKGEDLDYVSVMKLKSKFFKLLYDETKDTLFNDPEYKKFFTENKDWLIPYAAFSCLRDRNKTSRFSDWKKYASYKEKEILKLVDPGNKDYDDFAVHYFIQYHLHKQLSAVVEYARSKGVILKGDLPIGIYRDSVDAWVEPRLYHMNKQAGAPPDDYSISGQNWRFPTYDWEEMAKDDYAWWRNRLTQMAKYFDAYRIDHILGFFRIWEIPFESIEGLMGVFNPAIPLYKHEIEGRGLHFDYFRLCKPYIRRYMIDALFGDLADDAIEGYLEPTGGDFFKLKSNYNTQRKVEDHFNMMKSSKENDTLKYGLYTLIGNIIFHEEPGSNGEAFHPKIAFHQTFSYKELDDRSKEILNEIYTHYFYHRQEDFWREQAMVKLPAIIKASNMLVCGEDLGMVPDCVPGVMDDLGILRLYIQRMPKESNSEFGHPAEAPYLSVASPSCHDMSTVRGWWEEDRARSQRFYYQILGHHGTMPYFCEAWISEEVLVQHLYSPAMWAIFPVQDIIGIDETLRRKDPKVERINDPSNPDNLWKYRMHLNIEELISENAFNRRIKDHVTFSGRNRSF